MGYSRCYEIYCQIDKRFQNDFRVNNENDKVCKMQFLRFPGRMQETVGQFSRTKCLLVPAVRLPFRIRSHDLMSFFRSIAIFMIISRNASNISNRCGDPLAADGMRSVPSLCAHSFICYIQYTLV